MNMGDGKMKGQLPIPWYDAYVSWQVAHSTPPDYYWLSLEHAWTRYVGLPVLRPWNGFLRGKWNRKLAHNFICSSMLLPIHNSCLTNPL
jgi:hypothetical protein